MESLARMGRFAFGGVANLALDGARRGFIACFAEKTKKRPTSCIFVFFSPDVTKRAMDHVMSLAKLPIGEHMGYDSMSSPRRTHTHYCTGYCTVCCVLCFLVFRSEGGRPQLHMCLHALPIASHTCAKPAYSSLGMRWTAFRQGPGLGWALLTFFFFLSLSFSLALLV